MRNKCDHHKAQELAEKSELALRVYTSNLLGEESDLVLHGGGNTSVKGTMKNVFGAEETVLLVKGSGWDLRTIKLSLIHI